MGLTELVLIAVGLSMDAFAVSVCKGLGMKRLDVRQAFLVAAFFGGFQALMPLFGWALGGLFAQAFNAYAHWIAFALLLYVGAKMLWDALRSGDGGESGGDGRLGIGELVMLAVATSIDAFAVGVSFAFLDVSIGPSVLLIGAVTFVLSLAGIAVGHQFGSRWERPAAVVGGAVLIGIGAKVLLEGLGVL